MALQLQALYVPYACDSLKKMFSGHLHSLENLNIQDFKIFLIL